MNHLLTSEKTGTTCTMYDLLQCNSNAKKITTAWSNIIYLKTDSKKKKKTGVVALQFSMLLSGAHHFCMDSGHALKYGQWTKRVFKVRCRSKGS